MCYHFREYLYYGTHFEVFSANMPKEKLQTKWHRATLGQQNGHVNKLVYAHNCTKNSTNSPFFLENQDFPLICFYQTMQIKNKAEIPLWKSSDTRTRRHTKFLQVDQTKRKQKDIRKHDNQFPSLSTLQPSDRVLIRNLSERKFILSN